MAHGVWACGMRSAAECDVRRVLADIVYVGTRVGMWRAAMRWR